MKHTPPPPPPRWLCFAAVAGLALIAALGIAAGREPPLGAHASAVPTLSTGAGDHASATSLDFTRSFDRRCLLCQQPLH